MTLRLPLLPALLLSSLLPIAAEKPLVATIDAQRAFSEYYATKSTHAKIAKAKLALENDNRLPVIAATEKELEDLRNKVRDTSLGEDQREHAFKQSEMKAHELRSLQRDTQQHIQAEQKKLNTLLVTVTRKLQVNVQTVIDQVATAGNFEMVFESGGNTSSQLPTLIYSRDAVDITNLVIDHLNSTDPNPPASESEPDLPTLEDLVPPPNEEPPIGPIE